MAKRKENRTENRVVYIPQGAELDVAFACFHLQFPLMLRGPTGTGKTTLVSHLARVLGKPLIRQVCNEDTMVADLIGRNLPHVGWVDGSATKSLRYKDGAIYYMDEFGEARQDAMTVVHSLADDDRGLDVQGNDETLGANEEWMLVASYNPFYQLQGRVKPSTAQRFITVDIPYPNPELEQKIIHGFLKGFGDVDINEKSVNRKYEKKDFVPVEELVKLENDYRRMADSADSFGLREGPGPRLGARTAKLIEYGLPEMLAIEVGMINPLTYETEQKEALFDVARKLFR